MILLDTSGLLAALFPDQKDHARCSHVLLEAEGPLVLSPFVLAETDYLISKLAGVAVELDFLAEVARGAYELALFPAVAVEQAHGIIDQYADLGIGLADASIVVLSRRLQITDLLSLDERHFRTIPGFKDRPFRILPADY